MCCLIVLITRIAVDPAAGSGENWMALDTEPPGSAPDVTVIESTADRTVIAVQFHGFYSDEEPIGNRLFQRIRMPGCRQTADPGYPELPVLDTLIAIPDEAGIQYHELDRRSIVFEGFNVFPAQMPGTDANRWREPVIDETVYRSRDPCPSSSGSVSEPAVWGYLRVATALVSPVIYSPQSGQIRAAAEVRYEITATDQPGANIKTRRPAEFVSYEKDLLYRAAVANYDHLEIDRWQNRSLTGGYLIIALDNLIESIQPLADWHRAAGSFVDIRPVSEVGSEPAEIKAEIQWYYLYHQIDRVLLVGRHNQIPMNEFSFGGYDAIGDYDYSCLEGQDWYPEVAVGRFHTDQPGGVNHMAARILNYIRQPPETQWFNRAMLCAHEEEYPGKYTQCKTDIRDSPYGFESLQFETFYPPEGATHAQVKTAIEQGCGWINYRGHGSIDSWTWSIGWNTTDVFSLQNGPFTPVVWNIACDNAAVDSAQTCLSQVWQDAGSNGQGGALANLGATRPSFTFENNLFDKALFRAPLDSGITTLGDIVDFARATIVDDGANGIYNARIYLLLGDPGMNLYTRMPATPNVAYPEMIESGYTEVRIGVFDGSQPIEGARVCLYKQDECHASGFTQPDGFCLIPAQIQSGEGLVKLTVTAFNYLPFQTELPIDSGSCGEINLSETIYGCTQWIQITVTDTDLDINPFCPDQVCIQVTSDSEPTGRTVILTETSGNSAEFTGSIRASDSYSGPGYILVSDLDTVVGTYHDADCCGQPRTVTDTALIDCMPPALSVPEITELGFNSVSLEWISSEPGNSEVNWGETVPPNQTMIDPEMRLTHLLTITGLSEQTLYYFEIASTDPYGNRSVHNNHGQYFTFTTMPSGTHSPRPTHTPEGTPVTSPTPHPTFTPILPTETPAPRPTATSEMTPGGTMTPTCPGAPTQTPDPPSHTPTSPSSDPTRTPTSSRTDTPPSNPSPSGTPTRIPDPSETPSATPGAYRGLKLYMPDTEMQAFDLFYLYFVLFNPEPESYECDVYLLLDIAGEYWSWPDWGQLPESLTYRSFTVPAEDLKKQDVLRFEWPEGAGSASDLRFIAGAFKHRRWDPIGEIAAITWRFE
ncbi:hypothetical protein JXA40_01820 [bacterium]|nr:hypothetical protein [candidate division CSSED10-310 bacterium]